MSRVLDKSESHVLINTKNALKVTDNPVIGSTEEFSVAMYYLLNKKINGFSVASIYHVRYCVQWQNDNKIMHYEYNTKSTIKPKCVSTDKLNTNIIKQACEKELEWIKRFRKALGDHSENNIFNIYTYF